MVGFIFIPYPHELFTTLPSIRDLPQRAGYGSRLSLAQLSLGLVDRNSVEGRKQDGTSSRAVRLSDGSDGVVAKKMAWRVLHSRVDQAADNRLPPSLLVLHPCGSHWDARHLLNAGRSFGTDLLHRCAV